jgi:hypothetical protein
MIQLHFVCIEITFLVLSIHFPESHSWKVVDEIPDEVIGFFSI